MSLDKAQGVDSSDLDQASLVNKNPAIDESLAKVSDEQANQVARLMDVDISKKSNEISVDDEMSTGDEIDELSLEDEIRPEDASSTPPENIKEFTLEQSLDGGKGKLRIAGDILSVEGVNFTQDKEWMHKAGSFMINIQKPEAGMGSANGVFKKAAAQAISGLKNLLNFIREQKAIKSEAGSLDSEIRGYDQDQLLASLKEGDLKAERSQVESQKTIKQKEREALKESLGIPEIDIEINEETAKKYKIGKALSSVMVRYARIEQIDKQLKSPDYVEDMSDIASQERLELEEERSKLSSALEEKKLVLTDLLRDQIRHDEIQRCSDISKSTFDELKRTAIKGIGLFDDSQPEEVKALANRLKVNQSRMHDILERREEVDVPEDIEDLMATANEMFNRAGEKIRQRGQELIDKETVLLDHPISKELAAHENYLRDIDEQISGIRIWASHSITRRANQVIKRIEKARKAPLPQAKIFPLRRAIEKQMKLALSGEVSSIDEIRSAYQEALNERNANWQKVSSAIQLPEIAR